MGIFLGVLTALTWGGSDFLARFATERMGTLRTLLYMQFIGFILLTIALPWLGGWGHLADGSGWQPWAWGVLAGCVNAVSTWASTAHSKLEKWRWSHRSPRAIRR